MWDSLFGLIYVNFVVGVMVVLASNINSNIKETNATLLRIEQKLEIQ